MKRILYLSLLLCIFQSCQYQSFLRYYFPTKKTNFPHFSKWDELIGSNSNPLRSCYDVKFYDWTVHTYPEKKMIQSEMKIVFEMQCEQDTVLFDFQNHLKMDSLKCSEPLKKIIRKKDVIFLIFKQVKTKNKTINLDISYHGTSVKILSYTAINWGKDKNGNPWVCTANEGIGPHHMMPCKNLLSDEPDSCMIRVGVPKNLVGVANGKLEQVVETDSEKIFHWKVRNPINIYNISFNVGDFVKLEKEYQDIHNMDHKIQIYALRYNQSVADTFYNQVPIILKKLENMFGIYPWWEDQCKIIETCLPHGLCMEHQSAISMTDAYLYNYKGFNFTLIHELSHEWWGNNVTAYDYGDLWLHEGFANYTEMLFLESLLGKDAYNNAIHYFSNSISNKRPIIKPYEVRYNCLVHKDDEDIYNKGALFLHTLRKQINNDSLFFNLLKETQTRYAKKKFTSNQFLNLVNEFTKQDYSLYFDLYLNKNIPPTLEFQIDKTQKDSNILSYKWKNVFSDNFKMNIPFFVGEQKIFIYPNSDLQQVKFPKSKQYFFDISQFGYILFKEETNK